MPVVCRWNARTVIFSLANSKTKPESIRTAPPSPTFPLTYPTSIYHPSTVSLFDSPRILVPQRNQIEKPLVFSNHWNNPSLFSTKKNGGGWELCGVAEHSEEVQRRHPPPSACRCWFLSAAVTSTPSGAIWLHLPPLPLPPLCSPFPQGLSLSRICLNLGFVILISRDTFDICSV